MFSNCQKGYKYRCPSKQKNDSDNLSEILKTKF